MFRDLSSFDKRAASRSDFSFVRNYRIIDISTRERRLNNRHFGFISFAVLKTDGLKCERKMRKTVKMFKILKTFKMRKTVKRSDFKYEKNALFCVVYFVYMVKGLFPVDYHDK